MSPESKDRSIIHKVDYSKWPGEFNPQSFLESIEAAYNEKIEPKEFVKKKSFAPSALGYGSGKCPRRWMLAFKGTDEYIDDVDTMGMANMMMGSAVHDKLQNLIKDIPGVVDIERNIKNEDPPINAYVDVVVKAGDKEIPVEIKSMRDEQFAYRAHNHNPSEYHLIQLLIYMKVMGVDEGAFLYENKNDQTLVVLPVRLNEKNQQIVDTMFDWMKQVRDAYERGEDIKRPHRSPKTQVCASCPFRKPCWEGEDGTLVIKTLKI